MLKSAYLKSFGCEIERIAAKFLFDDTICLENLRPYDQQVAQLTQIEQEARKLFDLLQNILCRPAEYSPKCMYKSLMLIQHLLAHGSDFCVEYTYELVLQIDFLQEYNSAVIMNEKNILYKLKGGSADEGEPVRNISEELTTLLKINTPKSLLNMRAMNALKVTQQETSSSVGGGGGADLLVGFGGVDHGATKVRQNKVTAGGFGSGLAGKKKGEKLVVGAQYSLEDMLAKERNQPVKYYDDEHKMKQVAEETKGMMDLLETSTSMPATSGGEAMTTTDLLDVNSAVGNASDPFAGADLLGTGGAETTNAQSSNLLDPLSLSSAVNTSQQGGNGSGVNELLDIFSTAATISSPTVSNGLPPMPAEPPPPPPQGNVDPFAGL
eukprot:CAMPEP_0116014378 /NCGR_PEP_ID=MMETSP0321-20121206/6243_1 /TAXON_ID=163516 /ORGANISM="Leptocylindrus danicus var. danicus, Strain B650" /LENGTH=380 /DNA_ID=CAMNT_0003484021 /DNA_START=17 /DNA_END=1159 /DNA_ORIENTATION=-